MHAVIAVTHYCERTGDAFWSEPVNALSNAAFVGVVMLLARQLSQSDVRPLWDIWLLLVLILATAVGSFLWHTLAAPWAGWADVVPIALFINIYLISFLLRVAGLSWQGVFIVFVLFLIVNSVVQFTLPKDLFNGSIAYFPAMVALIVMAGFCRLSGRRQAAWLMAMSLLFGVSLLLRTLDAAVCDIFPYGTHFVWHLLNAVVLYLAMRSLMD